MTEPTIRSLIHRATAARDVAALKVVLLCLLVELAKEKQP